MSGWVIQATGIVGAVLILIGFVRINSGKWDNRSLWYELDNLVGTALLGIYHFSLGAHASLVLNIVWAVAAINGLRSINHRRRDRIKNRQKGPDA